MKDLRSYFIGHAYLTPDQIRAHHENLCEVCEEQPATVTGQLHLRDAVENFSEFIYVRLCQDCADTEPGTPGNAA